MVHKKYQPLELVLREFTDITQGRSTGVGFIVDVVEHLLEI